MEHKLLRIFASLGVPGLALGVLYLLFNKFDWTFPLVPEEYVGPIIILFMLLASSVIFYSLTLWSPKNTKSFNEARPEKDEDGKSSRESYSENPVGKSKKEEINKEDKLLYCSFCGKDQHEVKKLIAGPNVFICDECSDLCIQIIDENSERIDHIKKLCELTIEAENENLSHDKRVRIRNELHEIAQKIRYRRRLAPGDLIAGCRLSSVLGSGNFATVWEGARLVDDELRKKEKENGSLSHIERDAIEKGEREKVAVKVFDQDKLTIGLMLWRFQRGIRAMQYLNNFGKLKPKSIISLIEISDDLLSFTMDYLPGGDLENITNRGWSLKKKKSVFFQVMDAIEFSHNNGIVHRDIKPANIVMDEENNPVLTDFDIAELRFAQTQSVYASSLGTPQFAAPEQLIGNKLTAESTADIYSLGKLLYYFVTESPPPLGSTELGHVPKYMLNVKNIALRETIVKAISFNPGDRFQSISEMKQSLDIEF